MLGLEAGTDQSKPTAQQTAMSSSIEDIDIIEDIHDDCLAVDTAPTDEDRPLVTVIGGGITGLSAAHELIQRGFRVQVVESEARQQGRRGRRWDRTWVGGLAANQYGRVPAAPQNLHPYYFQNERQRYLETIERTAQKLPAAPWTDANIGDALPINPPPLYDILDPASYLAREAAKDEDIRAAVKALERHEMEPLGKIYPTPWIILCSHLELLEAVQLLIRIWISIRNRVADSFGPMPLLGNLDLMIDLLGNLEGQMSSLDMHDQREAASAGDQMVQVWKLGMAIRAGVGELPEDDPLRLAIGQELHEACDIEIQIVEALQELLTALEKTLAAIEKAYEDYSTRLRKRFEEACLDLSFDSFVQTPIGAREILVVEVIGQVTQTRTLRNDQRRAFDCAQAAAAELLKLNIAGGNARIDKLHLHLVVRGQVLPPRPAHQRRSLVRPDSHVMFRILERHVAGEHGYRFFPNFYRHLFDIMRSTPILDDEDRETPESVFDQLKSVELFNVAQRDRPLTTINRSVPRSYQQARAQWDAFASFGATLDDMTRSAVRALKYFTSSSLRREKEYEDISWWDFMGGVDNYSPHYLKAMDQLLRATNSMRPSESDARSFGDSFVQLSVGWANPTAEKDMTLNGPTSEAWLEPWKRFLIRQGVRFFHGRLVGFKEREDAGGPCDDQELLPRWGLTYQQGMDLYDPEHREALLSMMQKALSDVFGDAKVPGDPADADVRRLLAQIESQIKNHPYEDLYYPRHIDDAYAAIKGRKIGPAARRLWMQMRHWDEAHAFLGLKYQRFHIDADFYILSTPVQVTAALIRDYGDTAIEEARGRWFDDFEADDDRRADRLPESLRDMYDSRRWEARLQEFERRLHHNEAEVLDVDFLSMYRFDRAADLAWPTGLADRDRNGRPRNADAHPYREINGVQYFYETNFSIGKYHVFYLNSPWALSSLSPQRYWRTKFNRQNAFLAEITADIGGFYSPGDVSTSKTAWQSSKFELANEVYAQIVAGLNPEFHYNPAKGWHGMPLPNYYYVDHALKYVDEERCLVRNSMPFLINLPGHWGLRPGLQFGRADISARRVIKYEVSHLRWVLAGTYMATHTRMTTMESAAESARHAVNAVLLRLRQSQQLRGDANPGGYRGAGTNMGNDCEIFPLEENELPELESLKELDAALTKRGLPHFLDILGIIEYVDTHREPFATALDGIESLNNRLMTVSEDFYVNAALRQRRGQGDKDVVSALLDAYKKGVFQPTKDLVAPILEILRSSPFGSIDEVVSRLGEVWKTLGTPGGD
jgi:hypothetical protein